MDPSSTSSLLLAVGCSSASRPSLRDVAGLLASTLQTAPSQQTLEPHTTATQPDLVGDPVQPASLLVETNGETNCPNELSDNKHVATLGQRFVMNLVERVWFVTTLIL